VFPEPCVTLIPPVTLGIALGHECGNARWETGLIQASALREVS
jgi:hypothetical protein